MGVGGVTSVMIPGWGMTFSASASSPASMTAAGILPTLVSRTGTSMLSITLRYEATARRLSMLDSLWRL
jgi:hypothetical protein